MITRLVRRAREARWIHIAVVNLRILIGFAFVPAATKKILGQPFTDPKNTGPFHDFLHAFHGSGWFYGFVGVMQLVAAALLCTQRFALLGAFVALPILTAITAFCWSTRVIPTATVATMMWLGTIGLILWDIDKWRGVVAREEPSPKIDLSLWTKCGIAVLVLYAGSTIAHGGVYRPRGIELDNPAFYVLPAVMLIPIVTFAIEQRRRRK